MHAPMPQCYMSAPDLDNLVIYLKTLGEGGEQTETETMII